MCILLYMKLIWCSGFPEIYAELEEGCPSAMGRCAFCYLWNLYMWNLYGVVALHRSMFNWRGRSLFAMGISAFCYMLNLCDVMVLHRSEVSICASCYMWNLHGVVVFHISVVDWGGRGTSDYGICASCYMWNLLYVMVLHRSMLYWREVHLPRVYLHAARCETYWV